jgi:delta-1-pyrroline-5-carboxylate synthetase
MRVLQGERIGTVFHKDAHLWTSIKEITAHEMAVAARDSSRRLQVYLRISSSFYNVKYELY